jgi:hypothetical protein
LPGCSVQLVRWNSIQFVEMSLRLTRGCAEAVWTMWSRGWGWFVWGGVGCGDVQCWKGAPRALENGTLGLFQPGLPRREVGLVCGETGFVFWPQIAAALVKDSRGAQPPPSTRLTWNMRNRG